MKRIVTVFATAVMCLLLITVSFAESKESSASWDLSGPTEITEEVLDIFHQVTEGLMGVNYEPIALLGTTSLDEQGGTVYCLLCRSTVVYPDAEPSYVLMYLQKPEDGSAKLQNIYEIWVDAHAFPEDSEEQTDAQDLPEDSEEQTDAQEEWPQNYYFSSGAGGWGTEVFMKDDWSFTGKFHDSDMGTTGEGYPYGTVYYCNFAGKFSEPELIGTNTYRMHLDQIEQEGTKDDEHIEDEIRYVCSDPYGFDDGEDFILYAPGAPVSELPEDCIMWAHWFIDPEKDDFVPEGLYLLYNENGKTAFVGMNESFQDNDS